MKKRLLSGLMSLVMLLSLVPAMSVTASAADGTSYPIRNYKSFASYLESSDSRDLTLENDIDYTMGYDDYLMVRNNQKLDLNGHKIRIDASKRAEFFNLITIRNGEFTLYDSKGGGAIEVEFARDYKRHSIITISPASNGAPAKFTMNGGTLTRLNPLDSNVYGNNGCISDDYFNPFEGGERPQITINGGTINCAYDWNNRERNTISGVQYMPTALLLRYSQLTVNGGTFNGIVWTDEMSWREGDAEPRISLNGGVFNFPFAVTGLLKNKTQMVIDGARFNDGLYVAKGIKLLSYEGNEPAMLIKSGAFDASGQNLKLDILSVTKEGGYSSQVKQQAIAYAMKLFPNSAIKLNGNIYTSENIGSRVIYDNISYSGGYYLDLNLKGPIEVIGRAWDLKEVLLDGSPIAVPNIRDGAAFMVAGSVPVYTVSTLGTHELVYRWYDLAKELRDAGWYYDIECGRGPGLNNIYNGSYTTANGICEWRYRLPNTPANIDAGQMAFTINLKHATAPTSIVYGNQYLLRYQVLKDTTQPITAGRLNMSGGDIIASDALSVNKVSRGAMENRFTVDSQSNWSSGGGTRSKTVTLKAADGYHFKSASDFSVEGANCVTAKISSVSSDAKTCVVQLEARVCSLLTNIEGKMENFFFGRTFGDVSITSNEPDKYRIEVYTYAESGRGELDDFNIIDAYYPYAFYFHVIPMPGYVVRGDASTVKIGFFKRYNDLGYLYPDEVVTAKFDSWFGENNQHTNLGACWSIGRQDMNQNLKASWESAARTLRLGIKMPVAGESPTSYQSISGLPSDVNGKIEWKMQGDTVFRAGKEYELEISIEIPKSNDKAVWPDDYKSTVVYINGVNAWTYDDRWGGPDGGKANAAVYNWGALIPYTVPGGNDGAVSGKVQSYGPKSAATVKLMQGEEVKYTVTTDTSTGSGQTTKTFRILNVTPGRYDLVVSKPGHLSYTVKGVIVSNGELDLTAHRKAEIAVITLPAGDVNGDGTINSEDLNMVWKPSNYLKGASAAENRITDVNGDGTINSEDLNVIWMPANYLKDQKNCTTDF